MPETHCREAYRRSAYRGFSGETAIMEAQTLLPTLENWLQVVRAGIAQAQGMGEVMPTYFYYDVAYRKADGKPIPVHFMQRQTPDFLEGTVRRLKLNDDTATKEALCRSVRGSALYDRELKMYRVNTSLSDASFELGRAVAFTPGWLENGSIWLHMEYKYLLEMLRAGLYAAFFEDFRNAASHSWTLSAMAAARWKLQLPGEQPESRRILARARLCRAVERLNGGISPYVADHDVWGKSFLQQSKGADTCVPAGDPRISDWKR